MKSTLLFFARLVSVVLILSLSALLLNLLFTHGAEAFFHLLALAGLDLGEEALHVWLFRLDFYGLLFVVAVLSLLYGAVRFLLRRDFIRHSRLYPPRQNSLLLAIPIGVSIVFLSSSLLRLVRHFFPVTLAELQSRLEVVAEGEATAMVFAMVLFAPFFEEIFFRGILFRVFERQRASLWMSLVLTAFLFAVYQMNVVDGLVAFALGLVVGLAFIWSRSIWVPILIHLTHNGFYTLWRRGVFEGAFDAIPELEVALPAVFVFGVLPVSLWRLHRTSKR